MPPHDKRRIVNFRPIPLAAIGLIMGIAVGGISGLAESGGGVSQQVILICVIAGLLSCAALAYSITKKCAWAIIISAAFIIGIARTIAAEPVYVETGEYNITGVVVNITQKDDSVTDATLGNVKINGIRIAYRVLVTVENTGVSIGVGDRISADCIARTPSTQNQIYNERYYLLSNGISVKAYTSSVTVLSHNNRPILQALNKLKKTLLHGVSSVFSSENAPMMSAILLGDRDSLGYTDTILMRDTGIAHLLALSGFHVSLLGAMLMLLIPKRFPKLRFFAAALFLFAYCSFTSFSPSLVRASVMFLCVLSADVFERRRDPLSSISLACILLLLVNPFSLYSIGMQLSFLATLGILLIGTGGSLIQNKALNYLANSASVYTGATVATTLVSIRSFGVLSIYGFLTNIVALPLFSLIIICGALLTVLSLILPHTVIAAACLAVNALLDFTKRILEQISNFPNAVIDVPRPSAAAAVLIIVLMFVLSKYILKPFRTRLLYGGCVFALFTAVMITDIITA